MEQMIPHHSIAILTSENENISDPSVKELADNFKKAQKSENEEISKHIEELKDNE